jgi:hypothetical protein
VHGPGLDPVRLLSDRAAIHDLVARYARGVDRRDFAVVESCFAPDVRVEGWGPHPFADRVELIDYIRGVAHFQMTMHMFGNQLIAVDGDTAEVDSYAMLTHHLLSRPKPEARGRRGPSGHLSGDEGERQWELNVSDACYVERLSRTPDGWVISERGGAPAWRATNADSNDPAVRELLDRAEIHDVKMQYAVGLDRRDFERVGACFAPQFRATYGSTAVDEIDALINFVRGVEHFASTTHFCGAQLVEVVGDEAWVETPAFITHREAPRRGEKRGREWVAQTRYRERYVRVDGRWRIAELGGDAPAVPTVRAAQPPSDDPDVRGLLDRAAIHDVVVSSAIAADRGDAAGLASCFERPDAGASAATGPGSFQLLGNQVVAIDGDTAESDTYVYVTEPAGDGGTTPWAHGARRLVDRLARIDGRWLITHRAVADNRVAST